MTETPLSIHSALERGRQVLTLEGELDLATAPELEQQVLGALGESDLILDLSGVTFIDSSGLALLISISKTARDDGRDLAFCRLSPSIERLVELTGVRELLGSPEP